LIFLRKERSLVWALIHRQINLKGSPWLPLRFGVCFPLKPALSISFAKAPWQAWKTRRCVLKNPDLAVENAGRQIAFCPCMMHGAITDLPDRLAGQFTHGGQEMSLFLGRGPSGETGHRTRRLYHPASEPLEDRALMSSSLLSLLNQSPPAATPPLSPVVVSSQLPKNVSGRIAGLYELSLTIHPLYQSIVGSRVLKAPMFNSAYTGPKLADLDAVAADATISPQQEFQFTGKVLLPIDVTQTANYSFLVNRGGVHFPGPIEGRPGIAFNAIVDVTTGSEGITGTVSLLNSQYQEISTTTLPASSVQIAGETVQVTVPSSLLPSSAPPSAHPRSQRESYAFSTSVPGNSESDVAGFVPEYTMLMINASGPRHH
jgi:hypothetical protein